MQKTYFILALFLFAVVSGDAQSAFRIQKQCPAPNRSIYGNVTIGATGNIIHTPCPTRVTGLSGKTRILDFDYIALGSAETPLSVSSNDHLDNIQGTVAPSGWWYNSTFDTKIAPTGDSDLYISRFSNLQVGGTSTNGSIYGDLITVRPRGNASAFTRAIGSSINVNLDGTATQAIGLEIGAFKGNINGSADIRGIVATAQAGYSTVTTTIGGDFHVQTGAFPATHTLLTGVRSVFTNRISNIATEVRGISVSDWVDQGGTVTTGYGIYIDNTLLGTTKYAIRSLSTADSLFDGAVRVPANPYGVSWSGSTKAATEGDVYTQIQSLGGGSVTGTGVANRFAQWTGASALTNVPMQYSGGTFTMFNTAPTDNVRFQYAATSATTGQFSIGAQNGGNQIFMSVNSATPSAGSGLFDFHRAKIGDVSSVGNGTYFDVSAQAKTFFYISDAADAEIDESFIANYIVQATEAGVSGAVTINLAYGSARFAAGASSLVVTNNKAGTTSLIFVTPQTNDGTCKSFAVTRASGSFTLTANAACTGITNVAFHVVNHF